MSVKLFLDLRPVDADFSIDEAPTILNADLDVSTIDRISELHQLLQSNDLAEVAFFHREVIALMGEFDGTSTNQLPVENQIDCAMIHVTPNHVYFSGEWGTQLRSVRVPIEFIKHAGSVVYVNYNEDWRFL